jgi:hypothetical protein
VAAASCSLPIDPSAPGNSSRLPEKRPVRRRLLPRLPRPDEYPVLLDDLSVRAQPTAPPQIDDQVPVDARLVDAAVSGTSSRAPGGRCRRSSRPYGSRWRHLIARKRYRPAPFSGQSMPRQGQGVGARRLARLSLVRVPPPEVGPRVREVAAFARCERVLSAPAWSYRSAHAVDTMSSRDTTRVGAFSGRPGASSGSRPSSRRS